MSFVITISDLIPLPRADGDPWVLYKVQQAPTADGPWTTIDTKALDPIDSDPTDPMSRMVTSENATLVEGWYRVVFVDGTNNEQLPTDPLQIFNRPDVSYAPTVKDVSNILRARTKDAMGNEQGVFNALTRPNDTAVAELIQAAIGDVTADVDYEVPVENYAQMSQAIALRAAMAVELSYFPESIQSDHSPYDRLERLYNASLVRLNKAVLREQAEEATETGSGGSIAFGFPYAEPLWTKEF